MIKTAKAKVVQWCTRERNEVFHIKVLGYADDLALSDEKVNDMTRWVTKIADASLEQADIMNYEG